MQGQAEGFRHAAASETQLARLSSFHFSPDTPSSAGKNRPLDDDELQFLDTLQQQAAAADAAWRAEQSQELDAYQQASELTKAGGFWKSGKIATCFVVCAFAAANRTGLSVLRAIGAKEQAGQAEQAKELRAPKQQARSLTTSS